MDTILFQAINGIAGNYPTLDALAAFLAGPLPYLLIGMLLAAAVAPQMFGLHSRIPALLALAAAAFSRFGIKEFIVVFYDRPRPFDALPEVTQLLQHESMGSFPSGHAIFFFTVSTVIFLYNRFLGSMLFAAAIAMGISRVYGGIHWPSDILAGALLGITAGIGAFLAFQRFWPKFQAARKHVQSSQ